MNDTWVKPELIEILEKRDKHKHLEKVFGTPIQKQKDNNENH